MPANAAHGLVSVPIGLENGEALEGDVVGFQLGEKRGDDIRGDVCASVAKHGVKRGSGGVSHALLLVAQGVADHRDDVADVLLEVLLPRGGEPARAARLLPARQLETRLFSASQTTFKVPREDADK